MNASLVDVAKLDPSIRLDIRYATPNNFTGKILYSAARCFLRPGTAEKLKEAAWGFRMLNLGVKIFDGYRPLRVQRKLWEIVPDERYVAHPDKGSKHNRGTAVDLTLFNLKTGEELDMGTDYDDFTTQAHINCQNLSPEVAFNRRMLKVTMQECGFTPFATEWWHFDDSEWEKYPLLDIDFSELP